MQISRSVEQGTQHPLASAIEQAAEQRQLPPLAAKDFRTEAGFGVSATLTETDRTQLKAGDVIYLGNFAWMQQNRCRVDATATAATEQLARQGKTTVFVAKRDDEGNRFVVGLIGVSDALRPEAKQTLKEIADLGIAVRILSGDRKEAAGAIATQLGLSASQVQAEVSPAGKVDAI